MRTCEDCKYWARLTPALGACMRDAEQGKGRMTWEDAKCGQYEKKEDKK